MLKSPKKIKREHFFLSLLFYKKTTKKLFFFFDKGFCSNKLILDDNKELITNDKVIMTHLLNDNFIDVTKIGNLKRGEKTCKSNLN